MKNKLFFITIGIIIILIVIILVIIKQNNNTSNKYEECITGGGYTLKFDTNGGEELSSIHVCIACPPDAYEDLPIPQKDGYKFDGWYYDKSLTKQVKVKNTMDITPNAKTNDADCVIGYNDITLHAKWVK